MYCNKCGEPNPDGADFCEKCGASLKLATNLAGASSPSPQPSNYSSTGSGGTKASNKITSAFNDAIALVKNPIGFMTANRDNDVPIQTLIVNYVAVLAAIPFIATLIGDLWYYRVFSSFVGFAFVTAVLTYILDIVAVFVVGFIIWKVAPNFGSTTTTQVRATRMAAYAFTPAFLISILNIIPFISFITILGLLYGLYILYQAIPILTNAPKDKVLSYLIVTVIATLVVYVVIGAIVGAIAAALFIGAYGFFF
ncbi:MAG: YIP1 family protein [Nitrososphaerales archaeon]